MDSGFNSVMDSDGEFDPADPIQGKRVVVLGLVAGLEALLKRYGRLSFAEVLQPAIKIARNGFVISEHSIRLIALGSQLIQRTEYGRRTFFPDGSPLRPGDILKQPELAEFLANLAEHGASYMYTGKWAELCVETVQREGGLMTLEELAAYQPTWAEPWKISYRGYDIYATSGCVMHGRWTLLALKTLEHTSIHSLGHFNDSADALEILVRIARAVSEEFWIRDYQTIDDRDLVNSRLNSTYTSAIWDWAKDAKDKVSSEMFSGYDTLNSIIVDEESNVVSGKHSMNSKLWGTGLFVQGIPLSVSDALIHRMTGPGKRRLQGASTFLVFKDRNMRSACGVVGGSNPYTTFQCLVNLIDYDLPADSAAELPRFGSIAYDDENQTLDGPKNWLD